MGPAPAAPTTAPVGRAGGVEGEKAPARPPEGEARKEPRPKERATASPTAVQRPPKDSNRKKNEEPRNHTSSAAEAPAPSASAERTSAEGAAPSPSKPGLVADSGQAAKGPLKLSVLALEDTWLRVVVDDKNRFELLLLAGSKRLWTGSSKFLLTVGNVQGTQVSLNGLKVPLPRSSSNIVRDFVITENFLN